MASLQQPSSRHRESHREFHWGKLCYRTLLVFLLLERYKTVLILNLQSTLWSEKSFVLLSLLLFF